MRTVLLGCVALWLFADQAAAQVNAPTPHLKCVGIDLDDGAGWEQREADCLSEARKYVSRKGDLLTLRLENSQSKTYRDNPKACADDDSKNCIRYRLGGYYPSAHTFLILIQYYEGSASELVSARTGKTLKFSGVPHFSPDESRFIDNDYAYGGPFDIAIGSSETDPPSLEWQQQSQNGPVEWHLHHWIDNDRIALRVFPADAPQTCQQQDCDAFLVPLFLKRES